MFSRSSLSLAAGVLVMLAGGVSHGERLPLNVRLDQAGYERIAQRRGVSVYKHRTSDIIRLGAEARINAPPDDVLQVLLDYKDQVGVIDRLSESRVLHRGRSTMKVYQRLNLPVIDDRDFTLQVRWGQAGELRWVTYHAMRGGGPAPKDGVVRVTDHAGSWQLWPVDGGKATMARFMVRIDLAGWLPKWMARSGAGKELPDLFGSIRKLVAKNNSNDDGRLAWSSK